MVGDITPGMRTDIVMTADPAPAVTATVDKDLDAAHPVILVHIGDSVTLVLSPAIGDEIADALCTVLADIEDPPIVIVPGAFG